jgi:hypothetical protein
MSTTTTNNSKPRQASFARSAFEACKYVAESKDRQDCNEPGQGEAPEEGAVTSHQEWGLPAAQPQLLAPEPVPVGTIFGLV